ncbi:hypothetical protein GCM10012275_64820 [Longimycelium tulufanense]|uniref:YqaJ viral recombinase domain-containing protein n=2 Tax=Longimycelium tulufanense TaxID=907463 RepID=A0A8J3CFC6_9PSEU|nr:hypothetical protein GCM10012275_64820 [Longimycelium tulufanense]
MELPRPVLVVPRDASLDEWVTARRDGIGGSEVAQAAGISPFATPFQLWLQKTGRVEPDFDDNTRERMYWGTVLEPVLLAEFARRHPDLTLVPPEGTYAVPGQTWIRATSDGLVVDDGTVVELVECKTGDHRQLAAWADDDVPVHYVAQCQWQAHVMGVERVRVVALLDTSTYLERVVERDDELIGMLLDAATEFWHHVQADTPPPVDASDTAARMLAAMPVEPGRAVELPPHWDKTIRRRHEFDELIKAYRAERDVLDNELRLAMGAAEEAHLDGRRVARFRAPSRPSRSCDYDRLATEFPDAYAACVAETASSRRLTYSKETS